MSESELQQLIQIKGPEFNCLLMRNNSGALKDAAGRLVRFGLGNVSKQHNDRVKSSDLIGITTIRITPDMVGQTIGIFTGIEVKEPGWKFSEKNKREVAQQNFINIVNMRGGIAGFASSVEEFERLLRDR